ncbi:TIGR00270 family protein [Candidatus Woesearchaeota archaeon]|nr:TIGR00270 family protein [Candidatus Woesearchaeota archaeon]
MECELCGKQGNLFRVHVEGSVLAACQNCSSFGKVIGPAILRESAIGTPAPRLGAGNPKEEVVLRIAPGFGAMVKKRREENGLSQEELAKKINEKLSVIHHIETEHIEMSIVLATKLEKYLHIALVEEEIEGGQGIRFARTEGMTLGDFIKVKK